MSKKSDWTLLRFCQHRQLGLWGWGWTIKSLCCHLRIWRLETVMQGRPSYTPQTLKTLPGIPWSDGSFDNQPGHNLTTTRQPTPVCLFQLLVFYSHMLHVLFSITYGSICTHLPWRPLNLNMSFQRQFLLPTLLFTQQMKDLYAPENIVCELLHSGKNFRGICKYGKME